MRPLLPVVALVALVSPARAATSALTIPLLLDEPAGVAQRGAPVSASVPFARAALRAPEVWVASPEGHPVATQSTVLERWSDGSVRWLLVDFLADVGAHAHATFVLHAGEPPKAPAGARIVSKTGAGGARTIDTGPLQASFVADGGLVAALAAGDDRLPAGIALPSLVVADAPSAAPASRPTVDVETEGPVRTELVVRGRYPAGLAYETRIAFFAGQPAIRLQHTLTNLTDPDYARIRSLALHVPAHVARAAAGVDGRAERVEPGARPHVLAQDTANETRLDDKRAGRRADGWLRASDPRLAVTLVVPRFWEEYPAAFGVSRDGLDVDLFAAGAHPVALGRGAAKTHELWLLVQRAGDAPAPDALAAALRAPLVAFPPAAWIVASGALPQALAPDAPGATDFLAKLGTAFVAYEKRVRTERWDDGPPVPCPERRTETPRVGFYGVLNWGDWNFPGYRDKAEGCDGWGNLEYDLSQVLALGWLATRNREMWDAFVAAARHYRDVDVIHHMPQHPDWVGLNHPHKASHFAPESPSKVDLGHTWTEGLLTHYRLTGERRSLEAARGIAEALVPRVDKAGNPRQHGWPMIAVAAVADATNDERLLGGARRYAARAMDHFDPTPAAGDWKMGIMADGIAYVHAATGDERMRRWLVAYADALLLEPAHFADPRYSLPLGYLAARTDDARYAVRARAVAKTLKLSDWGKPLAAMGRTGFRLLAPISAFARDRVPGER